MWLRMLWLAAGALTLAACAQPTPYQPADDGEGYSEQQLEADRYRITFAGNAMTPRGRVADGLLLRAADLTKETGGEHFVVVDRAIERSVTYRSTIRGLGGHGFHGFGGFHDRHGFGGSATATARPIDRYTAYADIVVRDGPKPEDDPNAYAADAILDRVRPRFQNAEADAPASD